VGDAEHQTKLKIEGGPGIYFGPFPSRHHLSSVSAFYPLVLNLSITFHPLIQLLNTGDHLLQEPLFGVWESYILERSLTNVSICNVTLGIENITRHNTMA
jgi:hypothetical protein